MSDGWLRRIEQGDTLVLLAGGSWTMPMLASLDRALEGIVRDAAEDRRSVRIVLDDVESMDTSGAWLLYRAQRDLTDQGHAVEMRGARRSHDALIARIRDAAPVAVPADAGDPYWLVAIARIGRIVFDAIREARDLVGFYGEVVLAMGRVAIRPWRLRWTSLVHHIEDVGLDALPIVGLLSFLIGVVLAFQGADQLRRFGAELFAVNLLGVSILREIGILMTAIIVAGRSGSAFTAQIGTMKVNEEIDALRTLGLDPIEMLVLPRLLALMLIMPLLAFYANIMGLLGGGLMIILDLGISVELYLSRLWQAIWLPYLWAGLVKAPVFAFLIGLVGCYEGFKVAGSAESVGRQTTQSVVVSIFLVIVADAIFSIVFSVLRI